MDMVIEQSTVPNFYSGIKFIVLTGFVKNQNLQQLLRICNYNQENFEHHRLKMYIFHHNGLENSLAALVHDVLAGYLNEHDLRLQHARRAADIRRAAAPGRVLPRGCGLLRSHRAQVLHTAEGEAFGTYQTSTKNETPN